MVSPQGSGDSPGTTEMQEAKGNPRLLQLMRAPKQTAFNRSSPSTTRKKTAFNRSSPPTTRFRAAKKASHQNSDKDENTAGPSERVIDESKNRENVLPVAKRSRITDLDSSPSKETKRRKIDEDNECTAISPLDASELEIEVEVAAPESFPQPSLPPFTLDAKPCDTIQPSAVHNKQGQLQKNNGNQDPLFEKLPFELRRKIFNYCIPSGGVKCREEVSQHGEIQVKYALDSTPLSMLRVSSRWLGELTALFYKNTTFVISGRGFCFDTTSDKIAYKRISRNDEPLGPRDSDIKAPLRKLLRRRLNAKCSLLTGSSKSEPHCSPYLGCIQNLTFLIDQRQFDHDWLFRLDAGEQPPLPEGFPSEDFWDENRKEFPGRDVNRECRGRVQGRLSIHSQAMDNLCQIIEKSQPDLTSVTFELGCIDRQSDYDEHMVELVTGHRIVSMGDRKAFLDQTLGPFMVSLRKIKVAKISAGPNMKVHLDEIQDWQIQEQHMDTCWGFRDSQDRFLTTTVPDHQKVDYRWIFEEIQAKAATFKSSNWPEIADITELGRDLKNLARSFTPHPRNSEPNWCAIVINRPYYLPRETYEDILEIEYLMKTKPTLSSIRSLRRRVYSEITPRYQHLQDRYAVFMQAQHLFASVYTIEDQYDMLEDFSNSFYFEPWLGPLWLGITLNDYYLERNRWDPDVFNRDQAWKELTASYQECMITPGKPRSATFLQQYREFAYELLKHYDRIVEAWNLNQRKYSFLDQLGDLPQVRTIDYPIDPSPGEETTETETTLNPRAAAEKPRNNAEERQKDKMRRTIDLDAMIQQLVNRGESLQAWVLFKVLSGDTESFCIKSLPPKAKSTVTVSPLPRLLDRPVMKLYIPAAEGPLEEPLKETIDISFLSPQELAYNVTMADINEKMVKAGINMSYELLVSCCPDEFRGAVGIEAYTIEMLRIAEEKAEKQYMADQMLRDAHRQELVDEGYGI